MRIALMSDIHGQLAALDAVLADADGQGADAIVCLGDVATIGPAPNAVIDALRTRGIPCVRGNHDLAALDPAAAADYAISPLLLPALDWCVGQLTAENLAYLRAAQPVIAIPLGADATMLCCHGSPRSPIEEVLATTPGADLDALLDGVDAEIIAGGHTHLQLIRQHQGRLLVNPGSVGCPFRAPASAAAPPSLLPWAEYGIVTWRDGTLGVELRRVPFDRDRFRDELSRSDLPIREWWLSQIPPSAG